MIKRFAVTGMLVCTLALLSTHEAKADDVFLVCPGGTCSSGSVTQIGPSTVNFDFVYQPNHSLTGDWEIAVLVPNGGAAPTVNSGGINPEVTPVTAFSSGKLSDVLSSEEDFGPNAYTFSSLKSASAQVGVTANNFTIYEYDFGTHTSTGKGSPGVSGISVSGAPVGSVIVGWVEDDNLQTPLSGSITVPEPPTHTLFSIGLVALLLGAAVLRHRLAIN